MHCIVNGGQILVQPRHVLVGLHLVDDAVVVGVRTARDRQQVVEAAHADLDVQRQDAQLADVGVVAPERPQRRDGAVGRDLRDQVARRTPGRSVGARRDDVGYVPGAQTARQRLDSPRKPLLV